MSQLERIYKIDRMLRRKRPPSRQELVNTLEVSTAQLKRDLAFMRDRLGAPITFAPNLNGYQYASGDFNLPGLWFSESEIYSLLLMYSLLDQLQPGFVREQLEPFEAKLRALLEKPAPAAASVLDRMHVSAAPQRPVNAQHFQAICDGTLRRKKLRMRYYTRYRRSEERL